MKKVFIKYMILFFSLILVSELGNAKTIKGIVYGKYAKEGRKIISGATIKLLNSNIGAITDEKGEFSIDIKSRDKIIVSFVGFNKDTIEVGPDNEYLEIVLEGEYKFDEVVVQEKMSERYIEESKIEKTEVLTQNSLKKAACCNLSESFVTNPTVDVTFTDAITGIKQIQLLGLAQNYTQILMEETPNLQGFASNYGLFFIPGPWINSISISKGTSSVTRGYESITGQINVDLKEFDNADNLYLNGYLNDVMRFEGNLVSKAKINDELSTIIFGNATINRKYVDYNGDGFIDIPLSRMFNFLTHINYRIKNFESKTYIHGLVDEISSGQTLFFRLPENSNFWGSEVKIKRINLVTKNGYIFDGENQSSFGSILSFVHHKQNSYFGKRIFNLEQNSVLLNFIFSSQINPFELFYNPNTTLPEGPNLTFGFSFAYNNYLQYLDSLNLSAKEIVPGFFSEVILNPFEDLTIVPGIRVDFHNKSGTLFTPRIHIKYKIDELNTVRFSAGKGYHFPLPIVENQSILNSSRIIYFDDQLKMEEAWNFGVNTSHTFEIFGLIGTLNIEYYRTNFINQVIVDKDVDPTGIYISNLKGRSFSNSFQIDLSLDFLRNISLLLAYRLNDVWLTTNNQLQRKPLISPHKILLNLSYKPAPFWFDFTIDFNGGGRIPNTSQNTNQYRLPSSFKSFVVLFAQFTYRFKFFEFYIGGENLTDFKQNNPILAFDNPFSKYFDSSVIWGPIDGRKIYIGMRFSK